MTFEELKALDHQYTMQTYGRFDVALDHGKGATLYGLEGEVYTDFASGIGVASLGYGHPAWVKAVSEQAQKLQHASNLFYTEPYAKVAEKLCKRTGMAAVETKAPPENTEWNTCLPSSAKATSASMAALPLPDGLPVS